MQEVERPHGRFTIAAHRAEHFLLGVWFGSQIVVPLISSLVSANALNRQTHLHRHVPVSVCVCVLNVSVRVQYKPPSPDDFL